MLLCQFFLESFFFLFLHAANDRQWIDRIEKIIIHIIRFVAPFKDTAVSLQRASGQARITFPIGLFDNEVARETNKNFFQPLKVRFDWTPHPPFISFPRITQSTNERTNNPSFSLDPSTRSSSQ